MRAHLSTVSQCGYRDICSKISWYLILLLETQNIWHFCLINNWNNRLVIKTERQGNRPGRETILISSPQLISWKYNSLSSEFTHHLLSLLTLLDASATCVPLRMLKNMCTCVCVCVWVYMLVWVWVCGGGRDAGEQLARAYSSAGQSCASLDSHTRWRPTHKWTC